MKNATMKMADVAVLTAIVLTSGFYGEPTRPLFRPTLLH
jgi:hypothetical protein